MTGHVRKKGKSWYYSFEGAKVGGERKKIERKGGSTKKEAEVALRKAITEYENAGALFEPVDVSVSDFFDYWMKNYVVVNLRYNTRQAYRVIIDNHIKPSLGYYKVKSLTPGIVQEFINAKYLSGFAKHYLTNLIAVMSGALKYAVYPAEYIKASPMLYVKMPKYETSKEEVAHRIITQDEYDRILARFPFGDTFHMSLVIGYNTGFRIGEVMALTWEDVDFETKTISVDKNMYKRPPAWYYGPPKTKSSERTIHVGDSLIATLRRHKRLQQENRMKYGQHGMLQYETTETDPDNGKQLRRIVTIPAAVEAGVMTPLNMICTKESGEMITPDSFKYASRVIHYELGIDCNFHSLRHTHATVLIQQGAIPKDVQERLGHSDVSTTINTYTHDTEIMSKQTVDLFESYSTGKK